MCFLYHTCLRHGRLLSRRFELRKATLPRCSHKCTSECGGSATFSEKDQMACSLGSIAGGVRESGTTRFQTVHPEHQNRALLRRDWVPAEAEALRYGGCPSFLWPERIILSGEGSGTLTA
jgi:hypothetical protein